MNSWFEYVAVAFTTVTTLVAAAYSLRSRMSLEGIAIADRLGAVLSGIAVGVLATTPVVWFVYALASSPFAVLDDRPPLVDALMTWWPVVAWTAGVVAIGREIARVLLSDCAPTGAEAP